MQSHEQTSICICMCSAHIFIDTYTGTHAHTNTHGLAALSVSLQCFTGRQSDWEHWYPESFQFWLSLRYKSYDLWRQHLEVHGLWQDLGNRPWRFDSTGIFRNAEGERQDLVWKRLTQPCSLECRCGCWKGVGVHALLSEQSKRRISSFAILHPFWSDFPPLTLQSRPEFGVPCSNMSFWKSWTKIYSDLGNLQAISNRVWVCTTPEEANVGRQADKLSIKN